MKPHFLTYKIRSNTSSNKNSSPNTIPTNTFFDTLATSAVRRRYSRYINRLKFVLLAWHCKPMTLQSRHNSPFPTCAPKTTSPATQRQTSSSTTKPNLLHRATTLGEHLHPHSSRLHNYRQIQNYILRERNLTE